MTGAKTKGPRVRRPLALGLTLALLAGAGWWGWSSWQAAGAPAAPTTAAVARASLSQTVLATGQVESRELVSVGARVSGQVQSLPLALGDTVKKGELIAQIESSDQSNSVLEAEASLKQLEAQIEAQKATIVKDRLLVTRYTTLNGKSLTSSVDLEAARADLAVAEADLDALLAQKDSAGVSLETAKTELERTKITAPINGTVVAIVNKEGTTVNANTSSPTLVKLADLEHMVVKAQISEADVVNVKAGQPATFTLSGAPDMKFDATLRAIEPAPDAIADDDTIDSDTAIYYNALLDVDNPEGVLRIGMTAEVTITLATAENALSIPSAALGKTGADGSRSVLVWDPQSGRTETRAVRIGINTNVRAEVLSGLKEGERVVTTAGTASAPATDRSSRRGGPPPMMGF